MGEKRGGNLWIVLALAHVAAVVALPPGLDDNADLNLSCTNAFDDVISCHVDREECSGYSLTVRNDRWADEKNCSLRQCDVGRCCCSVRMMLTLRDTHTVTVWGKGRSMESKKFGVYENMKPKTPTIKSVKEFNGNFEVLWDTKMRGIAKKSLTAEVTYYKAPNMTKKRVPAPPVEVDGLSYFQIPGSDLEPNTTYMVSVRSKTNWSGLMSDSSSEFEFKTRNDSIIHQQRDDEASSSSLFLTVIVSLSVAAIVLSGVIYLCFDRLKRKWWDIDTKYPNLVIKHSSEQEVLRPLPTIISSVSFDPIISDDGKQWSKTSALDSSGGSLQHSSGISTGSSDLGYANTEPANIIASVQDALCKIFPNISPVSQLPSAPEERNNNRDLPSPAGDPCGNPANEMSCGSSGLINKTYSILVPLEKNSPEVHMQTEISCESTYRPNGRDGLDDRHQQLPVVPGSAHELFNFLSAGSSSVETDLSYQPCNPESGTFSDGSTYSSFSHGANTTMSSDLESRDGSGCGIVDEAVSGAPKLNGSNEGSLITDTEASGSSASADPQGGLFVEDDYQPFQNLVGQRDVLLLKPTGLQPEKGLDRQKEDSLSKIPQNLFGPTSPGSIDLALSGQAPFLPFLSAQRLQSVTVDSDYHSV
ncbi:uncharacterized protein LOC115394126 [Salarias fasciatus]|uniref:Uncharacterized LOC115394126 n=1 Tax=Salarias fasciatus TaxID=181472 RepID=A0A672FGW9_SALFA|nr:uncharacterized protein LOC115394126 [Salarias fasciatus]